MQGFPCYSSAYKIKQFTWQTCNRMKNKNASRGEDFLGVLHFSIGMMGAASYGLRALWWHCCLVA